MSTLENNEGSFNVGKSKGKYTKQVINGQELIWNAEYGAWGIFRPHRKNPKTGELEWAKMHGKKAFFIPIYYGPGPAVDTK